MAARTPRVPFKPPISEAGITRFPSQILWEDPREAGLDIRKLRAKEPVIRVPYDLAAHPDRPGIDFELLHAGLRLPSRQFISSITTYLNLSEEALERLHLDLDLVSMWFRLPEVRRETAFETAVSFEQLEQIARRSDELAALLAPYALEVEEWLAVMPDELALGDHNLVAMANNVCRLSSAIRNVLDVSKHRGRPADSRRNIALVLTIQAVEEATGQKVCVTRESRNDGLARFSNTSGQVAAEFVSNLTGAGQPHLVVAFERLRRNPRKKSD